MVWRRERASLHYTRRRINAEKNAKRILLPGGIPRFIFNDWTSEDCSYLLAFPRFLFLPRRKEKKTKQNKKKPPPPPFILSGQVEKSKNQETTRVAQSDWHDLVISRPQNASTSQATRVCMRKASLPKKKKKGCTFGHKQFRSRLFFSFFSSPCTALLPVADLFHDFTLF